MPATETPRSVNNAGDHRLTGAMVAFLWTYGGSLLLLPLGASRVLTYHEVLFAQPAREMTQTGNWIRTNFLGAPSNHKPPLTHWSIALSTGLAGSDNAFFVRLPIALASLGATLILASLAARFHGARVGFWTGLIQLTAVYFQLQARLAESDMLLCAAVTLGLSAFAIGSFSQPTQNARWSSVAFYLGAGLAFLAKGPIGAIFVFGPSLTYVFGVAAVAAWRRRQGKTDGARSWDADAWTSWKFFASPLGIATFLLCVFGWPIAAYLDNPAILDDWKMHHLGRFAGAMGGAKPFGFYFIMAPFLLLPWTPMVAYGLVAGRREGKLATPFWRFLAVWFAVGFAVLQAAAWKHKHYLIPILPPAAIVAAWGLEKLRTEARRFDPSPVAVGVTTFVIVLVAIGAVFAMQTPAAAAIAGLIVVVGLGVWLSSALFAPRPTASFAVAFGAAWIVGVLTQFLAIPSYDSYRDQTDWAQKVGAETPADAPIYLVALPENQVAYYLRAPVRRADDEPSLIRRLVADAPREAYVVAPGGWADRLAELGSLQTLDACPSIRKIMSESDRLTLFRLEPRPQALADRLESRAR